MIFRRAFETDGGDAIPLLAEQTGKVLDFPAFGFPAGSVIFRGIERLNSRSKFAASGTLIFDVADIFGNAAFSVIGWREKWGFIGGPIVRQVREIADFSFLDSLDCFRIDKGLEA